MRISRRFPLVILLTLASPGHTETASPSVQVELAVRGPDTRPLANTTIVLKALDPNSFDPPTHAVTVGTDARGIARFSHPAGVFRMSVTAGGIAYGTLGLTEFVPGRIATPHLAPLARYASIKGTLPPEARKPAVIVYASSSRGEEQFSAKPDAQGHFDVRVPAGKWYVWAGIGKSGTTRYAAMAGALTVLPGQVIRGATLGPVKPIEPSPSSSAQLQRVPFAGVGQTIVWVRGTVRDEAGHPIPDATVFALATYHGGIRMYERTAKATTDAQGHYELKGEGGLSTFSVTIVATAPGKAPAWAWPDIPQMAGSWVPVGADAKPVPLPEPPTEDLVLSSVSGKLDVAVLRRGKPVSGASVAIYLENVNLRDIWAAGGGDSADRKAIEDTAYPIATTGEDGIARFDHLLPGRYRVFATTGDARFLASGFSGAREETSYAIGEGIPVRIGDTTSIKIAIYPQPNIARFRVLRPDGTAFRGEQAFSFGRVEDIGSTTSFQLNTSGVGQWAFESPGLWHFESAYRRSPVSYFPFSEPFIAAIGTLAISPSLDAKVTPTFTARPIEPASAFIRVQDAVGNPLRATIQIDLGFDDAAASGSTEQDGSVRFTGLTARNDYIARAFAPGFAPIDLGDADSPLPAIGDLRNRSEILAHPLSAIRDTETKLVLRPEPAGYVYGTLRPPAGQDASSVQIYIDPADWAFGASVHFRDSTGEFAAGPFRAGTIRLRVVNGTPRDGQSEATVSADIRPGQVTRLDITGPTETERLTGKPNEVIIGIGGMSSRTVGAHRLTGQVFLADGVTPRWGRSSSTSNLDRPNPPSSPWPTPSASCTPEGSGKAPMQSPPAPAKVKIFHRPLLSRFFPAPRAPPSRPHRSTLATPSISSSRPRSWRAVK